MRAWWIAVGLVFPAAAQTPKEIALGSHLAAQIENEHPLCKDTAAGQYVERIAARLAQQALPSVHLTVRLVETGRPFAAALPGGFLLAGTGLVMAAANEAQLAGYLAHQLGHIAAKHGQSRQTPAAGPAPLVFFGGWAGVCTRFTDAAALPLSLQQRSPAWEAEADRLARQYTVLAGYDPGEVPAPVQPTASPGK